MIGKEVMRIENMNEQTPLFREQFSAGFYFYKVFYKNEQTLIEKRKLAIQ